MNLSPPCASAPKPAGLQLRTEQDAVVLKMDVVNQDEASAAHCQEQRDGMALGLDRSAGTGSALNSWADICRLLRCMKAQVNLILR